jgi:hypothetical protein
VVVAAVVVVVMMRDPPHQEGAPMVAGMHCKPPVPHLAPIAPFPIAVLCAPILSDEIAPWHV